MRHVIRAGSLVFLCAVCLIACTHQKSGSAAFNTGRTVVVWISIDGLRPDYLDRGATPFFHRLIREGSYSKQLTTIVPSLTFPSHVAEATGVPAGVHGIPANDFYDTATHRLYNFPSDAQMLSAEPIWLTAQRQGIRTLVYDWPLSQNQNGAVKCDYFLTSFDGKLTDEQRLRRLLDTWADDNNTQPLQLIMGYIEGTDPTGHKYGPDAPQIAEKIKEVDGELARFLDGAIALFKKKMSENDRLYLVLTTDHGMGNVKTLVNFEKLFDFKPPLEVKLTTSGPLGMIYLEQAATTQPQLRAKLLEQLRKREFLRAYAREDVPRQWEFNHPTRTGDIVVMLNQGYTFNKRLPLTTYPVEQGPGPYGMHGFPVDECPDMRGFCVIWKLGSERGRDLGKISVLQIEPTVAALLGVNPATTAKAEKIRLAGVR